MVPDSTGKIGGAQVLAPEGKGMSLKDKLFLFFFNIEPQADRDRRASQRLKREQWEIRKRILAYPEKWMSRKEYEELPTSGDINLKDCPLETWIALGAPSEAPDLFVVGHIVAGLDLFASQWGAGMSVPSRGMNRYLVKFTS